jgi:hypothetical protein
MPIRLLALTSVLVSALLISGDRADAAPTPGVAVEVDFDGLPGDEERLEWALTRFRSAGMEFGDLFVSFESEPGACWGKRGLHTAAGRRHLVSICNPDRSERSHTVMHELAHVWVSDNVDDSTRIAFTEHVGLEVWNDLGIHWEQRATEHAAEILAWGAGDQPCWDRPNGAFGESSVRALTERFSLLTGSWPICDAATPMPGAAPDPRLVS